MPAAVIQLDIREIPDQGLALSGEITEDIFQLPESDQVRSTAPIRYDARAYVIDGDLVVEGEFHAEFEVECSRCLEKFIYAVDLFGHNLAENLENPLEPDLTQALREDILLALPTYPHCEDGKIPRKCPAEGKFDRTPSLPDTSGEDQESSTPWAELDKIDGLDRKSSD